MCYVTFGLLSVATESKTSAFGRPLGKIAGFSKRSNTNNDADGQRNEEMKTVVYGRRHSARDHAEYLV